MLTAQTIAACPHCGSARTIRTDQLSQKGMLAGGMLGAAYIVIKLANKPFPVLASTLLAGCAMGLLWGAQAGRSIGNTIGAIFARHRCLDCGEEFNP